MHGSFKLSVTSTTSLMYTLRRPQILQDTMQVEWLTYDMTQAKA